MTRMIQLILFSVNKHWRGKLRSPGSNIKKYRISLTVSTTSLNWQDIVLGCNGDNNISPGISEEWPTNTSELKQKSELMEF